MKKTVITTILTVLCITSANAALAQERKAPSTVLQLSGLWPEVHGDKSFPWMETGKNPSGGEFMIGHRWNIKSQVILLEWQILNIGGSTRTPENTKDREISTYVESSIGPTFRINYGVLSAEAGVTIGPRGYLFGYIPGNMDENANGYVMGSYGIGGETFLRFGLGPIFLGGSFGLSKPIGGEPGEMKTAVQVNIAKRSIDTDNLGKVDRVDAPTRASAMATLGFWL